MWLCLLIYEPSSKGSVPSSEYDDITAELLGRLDGLTYGKF